MTLVVDITDWLDKDGSIPTERGPGFFRQVLRIAKLIEYGGPLAVGQLRETLVQCKRRPGRKGCLGLLWVEKTAQDSIAAYCLVCKHDEAVISNWQGTEWADGMMEPVSQDLFEPPRGPRSAPN